MCDYCIVTDSTCDLPANIAAEMELEIIPMEFQIDGKTYLNYPDGREYDFHAFYDVLRAGNTSITSQVNYHTFIETFTPILESGKDILYIAFSSGLSGTYNGSLIAAGDLMEKYPDRKVICVDSLAASVGEGLLVYTAAKKKAEGLSLEELAKWVEDNRLHLCHWFTVDDLNHLKRGGRVSPAVAIIGTALGIKPVLHVDNEGHLIPVSKVRGRRKSLDALVEQMVKTCTQPEGQTIFIGHGDAKEDAEYVAKLVRQKLKVKTVILNFIGPVIGSHSGPGTIALFFFGTER